MKKARLILSAVLLSALFTACTSTITAPDAADTPGWPNGGG